MSGPRKPVELLLTEKDQARFWSKVALPNEQGCMLWMKPLDRKGYGRFALTRRSRYAHHVSYALAYGEPPEGLLVGHATQCLFTHCVAPLHLEAVTYAESNRRADTGAANRAKTHCPQGHPYTSENTYTYTQANGRPTRQCRTCAIVQQRARKERERNAQAG